MPGHVIAERLREAGVLAIPRRRIPVRRLVIRLASEIEYAQASLLFLKFLYIY
jgi:hypothetical protein